MKLKSLIAIIVVLGLVSSASGAMLKVDLSCPGDSSTKAGGDWEDFEWNGGCDGDSHDPRSYSTTWQGMDLTFQAGDPGGKANLFNESGDALHNTILRAPDAIGGDLRRNLFRVTGLTSGDIFELDIDGESAPSSKTITGAGDTWVTIFDQTAGLDNFTMIPEPATVALLGLGSVALLRRKRRK